MSKRRSRAERAFTLPELLVVLAIVALGAAVIFPVLASAKEGARRTTCRSNLKQIATALLLYADDNDGFYPGGCGDTYDRRCSGLTTLPLLRNALQPYTRGTSLFVCPSTTGISDDDTLGKACIISESDLRREGSYILRTALFFSRINLFTITNPAELDLCRCHRQFHTGWDPDGAMNVVFVDGHVQWLSRAQLVKASNTSVKTAVANRM